VGERSGGAANPGGRFRTPQGYSVFISTGSPRNPLNGRNWEKDGVKPDVEVASERAVDRAHQLALEKVLAGPISGAERTDAQWVLESLRARAVTQPTRLSQHVAGQFGPYELESIDGVVRARRARWPAMILRPLQEDHYYFENNPSRRIRLDREDGKVVAITVSDSDGNEQRLRRNGPE
jgi:hypothetical protein